MKTERYSLRAAVGTGVLDETQTLYRPSLFHPLFQVPCEVRRSQVAPCGSRFTRQGSALLQVRGQEDQGRTRSKR